MLSRFLHNIIQWFQAFNMCESGATLSVKVNSVLLVYFICVQ